MAGTKDWCEVLPFESSSKTSLGWWDLKQGATEEDALLGGEQGGSRDAGDKIDNWWPGLGRWQIGVRLEDATIKFPEGRRWSP